MKVNRTTQVLTVIGIVAGLLHVETYLGLITAKAIVPELLFDFGAAVLITDLITKREI
jgi:hypothetical protein